MAEVHTEAHSPSKSLRIFDSASRPHPFIEEWLALFRFRDLVYLWSARNITLRYKRSVLGVFWTLLEPLMQLIILTVVFSRLFRFSITNYPVYLLSGILLFDFVSRSTVQIITDIVTGESLSKRIHVPRSAFAVAACVTYLTNWVIALLPLFAIMAYLGHPFTPALLVLPLGLLITALFALGVGLIIATVGAYFPDVQLIYQVLLTAWYFATPILYPLSIVPESARPFFKLNPLLHMVRLVRAPVYGGQLPDLQTWLICLTSALGTLFLGWYLFTHYRKAFDYRV
jgi:ABC-type polysaccharide/polyol phosphate export permease